MYVFADPMQAYCKGIEFWRLTCSIVFKATHESSKAMRMWMGEMKKKR